jgi:hypothetical protein
MTIIKEKTNNMQPRHGEYDNRSLATRQAEFQNLNDLLLKQSKGKILLSREEKLRVQKYAESKRKERN